MEQAKERLRRALSRLEHVVDVALSAEADGTDLATLEALKTTQDELSETAKRVEHLEKENTRLREEISRAESNYVRLAQRRDEVRTKLSAVISQVEHMANNGNVRQQELI